MLAGDRDEVLEVADLHWELRQAQSCTKGGRGKIVLLVCALGLFVLMLYYHELTRFIVLHKLATAQLVETTFEYAQSALHIFHRD